MKKEKKKKNTHLYESPSHNKYDTGKRKQEKTPDRSQTNVNVMKKKKKVWSYFLQLFLSSMEPMCTFFFNYICVRFWKGSIVD